MALTQVSSKGIKDATLLNEDVNASANIAGSKLADNSISLAKLVHGDSNNNGKFLRANNGADPTFETIDLTALSASNLTSGTIPDARFPSTLPAVSGANLTGIDTDLVSDTSPQLGADLDVNDFDIKNGTAVLELLENTRFRFNVGGTRYLDVNAGGIDVTGNITVTGTVDGVDIAALNSTVNGLTSTTINNNNDNKVITATGTANTLQGEPYVFASGTSLSIGTQSPAYLANLHIRNSYSVMRIDSDGSNNDTKFYNVTGTGKNNYIYFGDASDDDVGQIAYDHNGDHMKFIVGASERMRLNSNGLQFGGSNGANHALDDYEQGSWTPVMKDASGNTYSGGGTITGHYVKVGEMVIVQFSGTSLGNSGMQHNQIGIHGIPFTPRETAIAFAQLRYGNNISTAQFGPHVQCDANNSIGSMCKIHDNAGDIKTINWDHMQHSSGYYGIRWTLVFRAN